MAGPEKKNVSMQCVHSNINEKVVELCQKKRDKYISKMTVSYLGGFEGALT